MHKKEQTCHRASARAFTLDKSVSLGYSNSTIISAGIVAAIAAPPGVPSAAEIPVTQVLSNWITLSAMKFTSSIGIPAFAGVVEIAFSNFF